MDQQPHILKQERNYLDEISRLRHLLMDIQLERRAATRNISSHEFRLKLDKSISQLHHSFHYSSFILGTFIKTRTRFVHALSEIRQEVDTFQNLSVIVSKYNLLARFVHENLIQTTCHNQITTDVSFGGSDKAFEVLTSLQDVDIYNRLNCAIVVSNNRIQHHTYNSAILESINNIRAQKMALDFRGVTTVMTIQEWEFLESFRQLHIHFLKKDHYGAHEYISQNDITCREIDYKMKLIIDNVKTLSDGLFSRLVDRLCDRRSKLMQKIGLYTVSILLCIVLFGMVCFLHYCVVNRLMVLCLVEDILDKQMRSERDRLSMILLEAIPPEYIPTVMNGIDKVYVSERLMSNGKKHPHHSCGGLKNAFDSFVKTIRNRSVEPEVSSNYDTFEMSDKIGIEGNKVPLLKCVEQNSAFGVLESVSLFMCDFVYLNDLVALSEPDQLINLVTCLIQILEARTKLYDVHVLCKNINEFSVISGSQSKQALRDVSEIANMALDIRASCSDLEVDILPDSKLHMRISIHTSDCVYKLSSHPEPRFHIYGDLIDIVTRLKNDCNPNSIHISEKVGNMLSMEHQYLIERRGSMILTNGMQLATQWLLGRRVSVCNPSNDGMSLVSRLLPIQLAENPIYRFDKEKVKYVSPHWMTASGQFRGTTSSMSQTPSESSYSESGESSLNHPDTNIVNN
ncbi:uncharacterized protein LOC132555347 [Ylistrum balloti]|uniref:uncharacterized protein LOC132555347 n=1 Tax=Ylistrum balloti TaxID=509963 RepID=UPI00290580EF|nr:uncharacterized protein LOC132555347 [Ylistrum balloti]